MKTYKAIFNRYNPQIGLYQTGKEAETEGALKARKRCNEIENRCVYGSMFFRQSCRGLIYA